MFDNKTTDRQPWTQQEDQALKCLYESLRINKWSHIAQQLHEEFGFASRTGKQCRERQIILPFRYNNHLDPALCRDNWTSEEDMILFDLHDKMGNKWAIISQSLGPGRYIYLRFRTDNSVKNHYFSRLRKSLRRLNKVIQEYHKKQVREIPTKVLYKIIEASQEKFKIEPMCDVQISQYACRLKNTILLFSKEEELCQQIESLQVKDLIHEIVQFNKNYKRKPKKYRKQCHSNTQIEQVNKQKLAKNTSCPLIEFNDNYGRSFFATSKSHFQEMQENEVNDDFQDDINPNPCIKTIEMQKQKIISPIILTNNHMSICMEEKMEKQFQSQLKNNEQILEALGLLEDDIPAPHPALMKKQTSLVSSEHPQQSEQFKFFDDSDIQIRVMCAPMLTTVKKESQEDRLFN